MSSSNLEHRAERWQPIDITLSSEQTLENPWVYTLPDGSLIAAGIRQGSHIKGGGRRPNVLEDRLTVQIPKPGKVIFTLIDAHLHSQAATVGAEVFRTNTPTVFMQPDKEKRLQVMRLIHFETQTVLQTKLKIEDPARSKLRAGLCYLIGLLEEGKLADGYSAGDPEVIVIRDGEIIFRSKTKHIEDDPSQPENFIGVKNGELGKPDELLEDEQGKRDPIDLKPGDILIAGTDGLFNLITKVKAFARQLKKQNLTHPKAILGFINQGVEYQLGRGAETDDISAFVYVHQPTNAQKTSG